MKKVWKAILSAVLIFLAAEAVQIAIGCILMITFAFTLAIKERSRGEGGLSSSDLLAFLDKLIPQDIIYLVGVFGVIACGIVFYFWYRQEITGEERGSIKKVFTVKNTCLLIFIGIGCQFFISGIMSALQKYFTKLFENYAEQMKQLANGDIISVLLLLVIIAPVAEELVFRGVILHKANRYITFAGANILQAVLFGIYHFNIVQGIYAMFMGLLLGVVYYKFKSLTANMFLHSAINTSSFLIALFPEKTWMLYVLIITGAAMLGVALYLLKPRETLLADRVNS